MPTFPGRSHPEDDPFHVPNTRSRTEAQLPSLLGMEARPGGAPEIGVTIPHQCHVVPIIAFAQGNLPGPGLAVRGMTDARVLGSMLVSGSLGLLLGQSAEIETNALLETQTVALSGDPVEGIPMSDRLIAKGGPTESRRGRIRIIDIRNVEIGTGIEKEASGDLTVTTMKDASLVTEKPTKTPDGERLSEDTTIGRIESGDSGKMVFPDLADPKLDLKQESREVAPENPRKGTATLAEIP